MSGFGIESLSPRAVAREVVALPFGLTWAELAPALPPLAGSGFVATRRRALQGLRARERSTLLAIEGGPSVVDLFVKRATRAERDRYDILRRAQVPIPELLAVVDRGGDDVVLVFEFLDRIGIDVRDPTDVTELLELIAHLSLVRPSSAEPPLPRGQVEAAFHLAVRDALRHIVDDRHVESWMAAYHRADAAAARMPQALSHGELYFQQVGRRERGRLVVFDLATVGRRPRFWDVAGVVAPIASGLAEPEATTFDRYLDVLVALGATGPDADADEAFLEMRWLRALRSFQALPWVVGSRDDPELGVDLDVHVGILERDLADLGAIERSQ